MGTRPIRATALLAGVEKYEGGVCKHCGARTRWARNGQCCNCKAARNAAWAKANPARMTVIRRRARMRDEYGISLDDVDRMLRLQCGRCAVCGGELTTLDVDHDHATGVVRDLLCHPCNTGLGFFRESPVALRAAANYIEAHDGRLSRAAA
jgi:hypothetical protein